MVDFGAVILAALETTAAIVSLAAAWVGLQTGRLQRGAVVTPPRAHMAHERTERRRKRWALIVALLTLGLPLLALLGAWLW